MHYGNGREAHVGDPVIGRVYNTPGIVAGAVKSITPSTNTCNCTVVFPVVGGIKEDYTQCDYLFHAEDAHAAVRPVVTAPTDAQVS